jgi:hypothetical protein
LTGAGVEKILLLDLLCEAFAFLCFSAVNPGREKANFSSQNNKSFHGVNFGAKEKRQA